MDNEERERPDTLWFRFWYFMQNIDRRIIYAILFVILCWTTFKPLKLPITPTDNPKRLYAAVNACPDDGVIFIMGTWGFGTQGENWPQFEALVYDCLKSGKKFAFMGTDPLSIQLYNQITEDTAAEVTKETGREIVYGVDWINFGYKAPPGGQGAITAYYVAFAEDVRAFVPKDYRDKDIASYPIMKNIRSANDFYMIFEVSAGLDGIYNWVGVIRPRHPKPLYGGAVNRHRRPRRIPICQLGAARRTYRWRQGRCRIRETHRLRSARARVQNGHSALVRPHPDLRAAGPRKPWVLYYEAEMTEGTRNG